MTASNIMTGNAGGELARASLLSPSRRGGLFRRCNTGAKVGWLDGALGHAASTVRLTALVADLITQVGHHFICDVSNGARGQVDHFAHLSVSSFKSAPGHAVKRSQGDMSSCEEKHPAGKGK